MEYNQHNNYALFRRLKIRTEEKHQSGLTKWRKNCCWGMNVDCDMQTANFPLGSFLPACAIWVNFTLNSFVFEEKHSQLITQLHLSIRAHFSIIAFVKSNWVQITSSLLIREGEEENEGRGKDWGGVRIMRVKGREGDICTEGQRQKQRYQCCI